MSQVRVSRGGAARLRRAAVRLVVAVTVGAGLVVSPLATGPASATPNLKFNPVSSLRLLDTRAGNGLPARAIRAGQSLDLDVAAAIPAAQVAAVALNVAVVDPTGPTYLTVYPTGSARPLASNVNVPAGVTRANLVLTRLGSGGKVTFFNGNATAHVIADLTGWYATGGAFTAVTPSRVLDTRDGTGAARAAVGPTGTLDLQVTGVAGIPASGVAAVAVNLTGTAPTGSTYITAYPSGTARPTASNLNLVPGQTAAVLAVTSVGGNGKITLYNNAGTVQLIADVQGWFGTGGEFNPLNPTRILDTRTAGTPVVAGKPLYLPVSQVGGVPTAGAAAVILSVTAVQPTAPTHLTVYPIDQASLPYGSTLNVPAGGIVPNLVIADARSGGVNIAVGAGSMHVVVDVVGWITAPFAPGAQGWVGKAGDYSQTRLSTGGGVAPLAFTLLSGSLPPGLTLEANGLLTGTPTTAGAFSATIEFTDGLGQATDTILQAVVSMAVLPYTPAIGEVGLPYAHVPAAAGATGATTWSITSGTLPPGLTLAPSTGAITGTPTTAGAYRITRTVTDSIGNTATSTSTLTVYPHTSHPVFAWGPQGPLGDGTTTGSLVPVQVANLSEVVSVVSSSYARYALTSDGSVWAWGQGRNGLLGNGATAASATPVRVSGLTGVVSIGASPLNAFAVKADGTVWAWGAGGYGLLGLGDPGPLGKAPPDALVPQQVPGLTSVTGVAGASEAVYVLKADGTVWAWGSGLYGALGNGTWTGGSYSPTQVSGLSGVTAISTVRRGATALKADGTVWAWGQGVYGQIGNGSLADATVPVQVTGLPRITATAGGAYTRYALAADGTVWAWGAGTNGELGNAAATNSSVPVQVSGLTGITAIAGTGVNGYALGSGGKVWAWGAADMQFGNGLTVGDLVPVQVTLLPPVAGIGGGAVSGMPLAIGVA